MSVTLLGLAAALLAVALGATRDVSPTARTPRQISTAVRSAGWCRGAAVTLWAVLALAVLVALSLSRVCMYTAALAGLVLAAIAWHVCGLADEPQIALPGGGR
jgi:hypothetical protein